MDPRIEDITTNLTLSDDGIWRPNETDIETSLSYPDEGNEASFEIEESSFWFKHRNECIAALVETHPPQGPLFDVGGGNGFVSLGLTKKGVDCVLVEPGPTGALQGKARGLNDVICSTIEDAGFNSHSIPAIGLFDVLEHIEKDEAFLSFLRTKLIKGGSLYLTVPAHRILWSVEDDHGGHFHRYSLSQLRKRLTSAGFKVEFSSYFFSALPIPIFLFRTLPSYLGLFKSSDFSRVSSEHSQKTGLLGGIINSSLSSEKRSLLNKRPISFGASIILAATS